MSDLGVNEPVNTDDEQPAANQALRSPGALLAAHREERGWTVEQVASQLNLAPRQVHAIENDNFAALPGMPIARGFIRAYAKLLQVDAVPLLATLPGETPVLNESAALRSSRPLTFAESSLPSSTRRRISGKLIAAVLLLVLLLLGAWAVQQPGRFAGWLKAGGDLAPPSGARSGPTQSAPVHAGEAASAVITPVSEAPVSAPTTVAVEATPSVASPNTTTADPGATGKDALALKMREDSWIEIRRADNSTVISKLIKAGSTETFEVKEPLSVVIGNASGVDATLRGNPLELTASARSNVVRLSLK